MKNITCNVVKDILPLYIDDVVSDDTRKIVEEHLGSCSACRIEAEEMKRGIEIPLDSQIEIDEAGMIKDLKIKFLKKKMLVAIISAVAALVAAALLYTYASVSRTVIPFDDSKISITESGGKLYAMYNGNDMAGVSSIDPASDDADNYDTNNEEGSSVCVFYLYSTPLSRITGAFKSDSAGDGGGSVMMYLCETTETDSIYYAGFDGSRWKNDPSSETTAAIANGQLVWDGNEQ